MLYYVDKGISRIPVTRNQNKNDIIGYVRTIDFLKLDSKDIFTIKDKVINIHIPFIVEPNCNVYELFTNFKNGNHMALITEDKNILERSVKIYNENLNYLLDKNKRNETKIIGIVTLEDVLENLIETDIKDESEKEKDIDQRKKLRMSN
jgi:CBS domain containing-hemolysin-like protein